jgi:hypothetical protein
LTVHINAANLSTKFSAECPHDIDLASWHDSTTTQGRGELPMDDTRTDQAYLTTVDAARFLSMSPRTLERLRMTGFGPKFSVAGLRRVLYRKSDLVGWLETNSFESTSQAKRAGVR